MDLRRSVPLAISITLLLPSVAHAGVLGGMRSETEGSSSSSSSGSSYDDSSSSSYDDDSSSSSFGEGAGEALVEAYIANVYRTYTRYPYADGSVGYNYITDPEDDDMPGQRFAGTFTVDGGFYGPTLARSGVGVELFGRRFGFGLDVAPHLEIQPIDALTLGSGSFLMAPVMRPRLWVTMGFGVGFMIDGRTLPREARTDVAGLNATIRATAFVARPVVLRGRFDFGQLGAASTMLGRLTAGAMLRRFEPFAGAEFRRVGSVNVIGPTAGLRVWF